MSIRLFGVAVLIMAVQTSAWADTITVAQAWQLAQQHLLIQIKNKDVEAAEAIKKQERLYDNPEVSISHNVNNPVTNRYFETNHEGQTDIQLSQRIYIGGQRSQRIRKAGADVLRAESERNDALRLLRRQLSSDMVTLSSLLQKIDVIDKEIASTKKILDAYGEQSSKGNIAQVEVTRIRSQYLQLAQERAALQSEMVDLQQSLRLATSSSAILTPIIDYTGSVASLGEINVADISAQLHTRADLQASKYETLAAEHEVKLQKANALPEVNLIGEWDKNGNIGHNCFMVGVSFSMPIFNRNQGGRKAANAALEARRLQQDWDYRQAEAEIHANWTKLQVNKQIAQEAEAGLAKENENFFTEVENQYLKRNISLLQLIDYYQAYKDTRYMVIDSQRDVLLSMIELDLEIK